MNWVRGKALKIVFDIKGMSEGDELDCVCGTAHRFVRWEARDELLCVRYQTGDTTVIARKDIQGWRPKQ